VGNHRKQECERLDTEETTSRRMRTHDRHRWEKEMEAKDVGTMQGTGQICGISQKKRISPRR